jgi:nicotinate-nucleotide adenylyltransferase
MNVAIFGGTFDPIHRGHLAVAHAAQQRYQLGRIYFVPADIPPHKQRHPVTPFHHRYAMVALGTGGERAFIPSLLEAPGEQPLRTPSFSIDTVRRFRATLSRGDRLFFLIGIDSFLDVASWHKAEELLQEVEFIVASRPGFSLADVAEALPQSLRPPAEVTRPFRRAEAEGDLALGRVRIHLLPEVQEKVSATRLRSLAARKRPLGKMVPEAVAEYIRKTHLYTKAAATPVRRPAGQRQGKVISIGERRQAEP